MKLHQIWILLFVFLAKGIVAQKDTSYWAVGLVGKYKVSQFDFNKRFGNPTVVGLDIANINKKRIISVGGTYWFGTSPKNDSILQEITVDNEFFISNSGTLIPFRMTLQGFDFNIGYQYRLSGKENGGWYAGANVGPYWYQTLILVNEVTPAMNKEIRRGYDHMMFGALIDLGVSYKHLSNTLGANYSFGLSYQLGFSQNVRGYSYYKESKVNESATDGFLSFNFNYYFSLSPQPMPEDFDEDEDILDF